MLEPGVLCLLEGLLQSPHTSAGGALAAVGEQCLL